MSINSASSGGTAPNTQFISPVEYGNYVAAAATGTINIDVTTSSLWYYTSNATGNFTLNIRGNSGASLANTLAVGQALTVVFANTNGTTAYYCSQVQIDGSNITPKWLGGATPTAGNASSIDFYTFTVLKTAATPTYVTVASVTKFA